MIPSWPLNSSQEKNLCSYKDSRLLAECSASDISLTIDCKFNPTNGNCPFLRKINGINHCCCKEAQDEANKDGL